MHPALKTVQSNHGCHKSMFETIMLHITKTSRFANLL